MKKKKEEKNSPCVPERRRADQKVGTGARDEPQSVVAVLRVLPEVRVRVVEDVRAQVCVVKRLRRQHHRDVVAGVELVEHLEEEVWVGDLVGIEHADDLVGGDRLPVGVDLARAVVQVRRLAVHLTRGARPPGDVDDASPGRHAPAALLGVLAVIAEVDGDLMMLVDIGWKKEKKSEFFLVLSFSSPTLSLDPPLQEKK